MDASKHSRVDPQIDDDESKPRRSKWLKWAGIGTFSFFLIKGLIWLGLGAAGLAALWPSAD